MTWLGEIGKIYRDLVENLRKKYEIKVKILLKIANFEDFPPIFCLTTADFLLRGGPKSL